MWLNQWHLCCATTTTTTATATTATTTTAKENAKRRGGNSRSDCEWDMHSILCKEIKNLYKLCTMNKQQQRQHNVAWPCPGRGRGEASRGEASCSFHSNCRKLLQLLRCRCSFDSNSSSKMDTASELQRGVERGRGEGNKRTRLSRRTSQDVQEHACVYICVCLCVCKLCLCPVQGN